MSNTKPLAAKEVLEDLEKAMKETDALREEYRRFERKGGAHIRDFEDTIRKVLEENLRMRTELKEAREESAGWEQNYTEVKAELAEVRGERGALWTLARKHEARIEEMQRTWLPGERLTALRAEVRAVSVEIWPYGDEAPPFEVEAEGMRKRWADRLSLAAREGT